MREAVPLLKYHAQVLAHLVQIGLFRVHIDTVHQDLALLDLLQPVDAIQQG